jgi:tRNA dimethylallyltransferase
MTVQHKLGGFFLHFIFIVWNFRLFCLYLWRENGTTKHLNASKQASPMITILGPTASGKTSLAAALADELCAEIISADQSAGV